VDFEVTVAGMDGEVGLACLTVAWTDET